MQKIEIVANQDGDEHDDYQDYDDDYDEYDEYADCDEVELWKDPLTKDLPGWRGPATVTASNRQSEGRITVDWQGTNMELPLAEVRPYYPDAFFGEKSGGALVTLMQLVDGRGNYSEVYGQVPTANGDVTTKSFLDWPEIHAAVHEAAHLLGWYVDGAIIGQGRAAVVRQPEHRARPGALRRRLC